MTPRQFIALLGIVLFVATAELAYGRPLALTQKDGITITITDEAAKCEAVPQFEYRIIWQEPGKTYEGCFGINNTFIIAYFPQDKSVALIPMSVFQILKEM